jgi:hypothetical protein
LLEEAKRDLNVERRLHNQAKVDLRHQQLELDSVIKDWKSTASQLNKYLAQDRGFHPITDEVLKQQATQLRFNIRGFASRHFDGADVDIRRAKLSLDQISRVLCTPVYCIESWVRTVSKRPTIILAYVWAMLEMDVLGQFRWGGRNIAKAMSEMRCVIRVSSPPPPVEQR